MAKAASPIRLQQEIMQAAELAAPRFHRSTAQQIEYWADLGRAVAANLDADDLLAIISGLARIQIEPVIAEEIDPGEVFTELRQQQENGNLAQEVTQSSLRYQASRTNPGMLEQIDQHGVLTVGVFNNGKFIARETQKIDG